MARRVCALKEGKPRTWRRVPRICWLDFNGCDARFLPDAQWPLQLAHFLCRLYAVAQGTGIADVVGHHQYERRIE